MAIGSKRNLNEVWKEYWMDIAGTTTAKSLNYAMRAGLEALGHSGGLNKMLKAWAIDQGGTTASITHAMKLTFADMTGESSGGLTSMMPEYVREINWGSILVKFNDEDRHFSKID